MSTKKKTPRRILVLDIGGSHVKFLVSGHLKAQRFVSGPELTAADMVKRVRKLVHTAEYDAVTDGKPGHNKQSRIAAEPFNLGRGWLGYDFEAAFGKPVRVINDAAMQAVGCFLGGCLLFLVLGFCL